MRNEWVKISRISFAAESHLPLVVGFDETGDTFFPHVFFTPPGYSDITHGMRVPNMVCMRIADPSYSRRSENNDSKVDLDAVGVVLQSIRLVMGGSTG